MTVYCVCVLHPASMPLHACLVLPVLIRVSPFGGGVTKLGPTAGMEGDPSPSRGYIATTLVKRGCPIGPDVWKLRHFGLGRGNSRVFLSPLCAAWHDLATVVSTIDDAEWILMCTIRACDLI